MLQVLVFTKNQYFGEFIQSLLGILSLKNVVVDRQYQIIQKIEEGNYCIFVTDFCKKKLNPSVHEKLKKVKISVVCITDGKEANNNTNTDFCISRPLDMQKFISIIESILYSMDGDGFRSYICKPHPPFLIGNSQDIQKLRQAISKMSATDFSVMIQGDTGTGKGVVARAIHANSKRQDKRFLEINCATLPAPLMESELFGHAKGAFTGAWAFKSGKFQAASDGTLFLDEIGEMKPWMQAKLLQVLQDGEFSPLGANKTVSVDVRILSATNVEIQPLLKSSLFRTDLFYRLSVVSLFVSPLRKRPDDIVPLAVYFLELFSLRYQKKATILSSELWNLLLAYEWPGNVRELENEINLLVALETEDMLIEKLRKRIDPVLQISKKKKWKEKKIDNKKEITLSNKEKLKDVTAKAVASAEKALIYEALKATQGNKKKAARLLQMSYKSLLQKLKTYSVVL